MPKQYPATIEQILAAQSAGQQAAEDNQSVDACPYRATPEATTQDAERTRFLQLIWLRSYRESQQILIRPTDQG